MTAVAAGAEAETANREGSEAGKAEKRKQGKHGKQREMEQLGKGLFFRVPLADGGTGRRPAGFNWPGGWLPGQTERCRGERETQQRDGKTEKMFRAGHDFYSTITSWC